MSRVLQSLNGGWVSVLMEQRKLLLQVEQEAMKSVWLCWAQSHAAVTAVGQARWGKLKPASRRLLWLLSMCRQGQVLFVACWKSDFFVFCLSVKE